MSDLWAAFTRTCNRFGDKEAIVRGDERMTFHAWHCRAQDYLSVLLDRGIEKGDRILVSADPSPETASAICGIWGTGAIAVLVDPDSKSPFLELVFDLVTPRLSIFAEDSDVHAPELDSARLHSSEIPRPERQVEPRVSSHRDPASILFTSGSSGRSKGVVQTHGALLRGCASVATTLGVDSGTRNLCPVPWSFDYGFGQLHMALALGVTMILPVSATPSGICEALEEHRPTLLAGVPSLYAYLLQGISPFSESDLSCLRKLTSTGSAMPTDTLDALLDLAPQAEIYLNYGLTESYRTSCLDPTLIRDYPRSVGRPIRGVEVVIVRQDGGVAEPGEEGEIVHCGDYLFRDYWNDPEATARALRSDPRYQGKDSSARALFTGDFGWLDERGLLTFSGRRDRQLKVMGYRIHPLEIESALVASGLVDEAAVIGVERELIGVELWAVVNLKFREKDVSRRLKAYCRQSLPRFLQPQRYIFDSAIPRTTSGKIDYTSLRSQVLARKP